MSSTAGNPLVPVILSGGVGARLWPVSREATPKPFMKVGGDTSLLRQTFDRARALPGTAEVVTVTNREFLGASIEEFEGADVAGAFILEPFGSDRSSPAAGFSSPSASCRTTRKPAKVTSRSARLSPERADLGGAFNLGGGAGLAVNPANEHFEMKLGIAAHRQRLPGRAFDVRSIVFYNGPAFQVLERRLRTPFDKRMRVIAHCLGRAERGD